VYVCILSANKHVKPQIVHQQRKPNMMTPDRNLYRVWIVDCEGWQPAAWHQAPPRARALEPALAECLPRELAAAYVEAFNTQMLAEPRGQWAVPFRVTLRYDGEPTAGQPVDLSSLDLGALAAQAA
jgi:hypothetical protein